VVRKTGPAADFIAQLVAEYRAAIAEFQDKFARIG
jgi:hypothetical protein